MKESYDVVSRSHDRFGDCREECLPFRLRVGDVPKEPRMPVPAQNRAAGPQGPNHAEAPPPGTSAGFASITEME